MKHRDRYKAKYEAELARANRLDCRLRMTEKAVKEASDTARKFSDDIDRGHLHAPPFASLAFAKVRHDIEHAYMTSIGAR